MSTISDYSDCSDCSDYDYSSDEEPMSVEDSMSNEEPMFVEESMFDEDVRYYLYITGVDRLSKLVSDVQNTLQQKVADDSDLLNVLSIRDLATKVSVALSCETLGWNATLLHSNPKLIPQGETFYFELAHNILSGCVQILNLLHKQIMESIAEQQQMVSQQVPKVKPANDGTH
jgi:hypothetical protein